MKKIIYLLFICLHLTSPLLSQSKKISSEATAQNNVTLNKLDSLNNSLKKEIDSIKENQLRQDIKAAKEHIERANLIIDWSAKMFTLLAVLLVIAGAIGIREFSKIHQTEIRIRETEKNLEIIERQMNESLEKINNELKIILNSKSQIIKEMQLFTQRTYYLNAARQAYRAGEYFKTRDILYNLLDMEPNNVEALFIVGKSLSMESKTEDANLIFDKMLVIEPNNSYAFYGKSMNNIWSDLKKAKEFCEKAVELNPQYVNAIDYLGLIYRELGDVDKALAQHKKARELKQYAANSFYIATIYLATNEQALARKYYNEANHLAQKLVERIDRWSWAQYIIGVYEGLFGNLKISKDIFKQVYHNNSSLVVRKGMKLHLEFLNKNTKNKKVEALLIYLGSND